MKRLIVAAGLALLLHALFLGLKVKWPEETNVPYTKAPLQLLQVDYRKKDQAPSPPSLNLPAEPRMAPGADRKHSNKKKVKEKNYKKISKASPKVLKKARLANNLEQKEMRAKAAFQATHLSPVSPPTPVAKFYAYDEERSRAKSTHKVKKAHSETKGVQESFPQGTPHVQAAKSEISDAHGKEQVLASAPITEVPPAYRKNPPPVYPRVARRRGYEGTVILKVLVNRRGGVDRVYLMKSSGYQVLDRAAIACVRDWVFEPGTRGGKSVKMWVKVPIRFRLKSRN